MDWSIVGTTTVILSTIIGAVWYMASWLSKRFDEIKKYSSDMADKIISKLEYHERHDDERFSEVRNDIWEIRLRNAAHDGRRVLDQKAQEDCRES